MESVSNAAEADWRIVLKSTGVPGDKDSTGDLGSAVLKKMGHKEQDLGV